jgi:hypothetical protein
MAIEKKYYAKRMKKKDELRAIKNEAEEDGEEEKEEKLKAGKTQEVK